MSMENIRKDYLHYRAKGCPARQALSAAKASINRLEWKRPDGRRQFERPWICREKIDGFDVKAAITVDEWDRPDWLGEFTERYRPGVIHHSDDPRTLKYFLPATTEDEHYKALRKLKYGRRAAREWARQYVHDDYERVRTFGQSWSLYVVSVSAMRAGVVLGEASLCGIDAEIDEPDPYCSQIAQELTEEAIRDARNTLNKLCTSD